MENMRIAKLSDAHFELHSHVISSGVTDGGGGHGEQMPPLAA